MIRLCIPLLFLMITGCASKQKLEGTFYYKGIIPNQKESEVVLQAKAQMKELFGQEGIYSAFIFKGENTVMIKSIDMEFAASYTTDGDYINIKASDGELVLKRIDDNTIHGEGFASGIYLKLKPGEKLPEIDIKTIEKRRPVRTGPKPPKIRMKEFTPPVIKEVEE